MEKSTTLWIHEVRTQGKLQLQRLERQTGLCRELQLTWKKDLWIEAASETSAGERKPKLAIDELLEAQCGRA